MSKFNHQNSAFGCGLIFRGIERDTYNRILVSSANCPLDLGYDTVLWVDPEADINFNQKVGNLIKFDGRVCIGTNKTSQNFEGANFTKIWVNFVRDDDSIKSEMMFRVKGPAKNKRGKESDMAYIKNRRVAHKEIPIKCNENVKYKTGDVLDIVGDIIPERKRVKSDFHLNLISLENGELVK